jgi:hypothetical protein
MLHRRCLRLSLLLALAGVVLALSPLPRARAEDRQHRHLQAALHELKESRNELEKADHDFGGHRKKAVEAINAAIEQTEGCLKFARIEIRYDEKPDYKQYRNSPHLRHAVVELREARTELKEAPRDLFGEHRDRAVKDIDLALEQIGECVKFAR